MDILLALTTGAAIFSYFVPTVEAYNPEEQQEAGKQPAPLQLHSHRGGQMSGGYPRQTQPRIVDEEVPVNAGKNKRESTQKRGSCGILRGEERNVVPEAGVATGSEMLRNLRDRTLLEQLGVGSYVSYRTGTFRRRPRRPALPPAVRRSASPLLSNHNSPAPAPAIIAGANLNSQEWPRTVPFDNRLRSLDPPPVVITTKLGETRDPLMPSPSSGALVPYIHPRACNVSTRVPTRNQIRANQFPQRQPMKPHTYQEPLISHVNANPVTQYRPGQLAIPRFHQSSYNGYNDRLGLAFHPPLMIGFTQNPRTEQGDAHVPLQKAGHRGAEISSWVISKDSLPMPPKNFQTSAWGRYLSIMTNPPHIPARSPHAYTWEKYSSTKTNVPKIKPNIIASSHTAPDIIRRLSKNEASTRYSHSILATSSQSDPSASLRPMRDPTSRLELIPTGQVGGGSSFPEPPKLCLPRAAPSPLRLPPGQGGLGKSPSFELPATSSGLPTDHNADRVPLSYDASSSSKLKPPIHVQNDILHMQSQKFATRNAITKQGARGTPPPATSVPDIYQIYGRTSPTIAGIIRLRPGQALFQPKPDSPFRSKESRDRNYRETPGAKRYGARKLSLRGGEVLKYRVMMPLRPPWIRNQTTANTPHHTHALSTENPVNQEGEPGATEHAKGSLAPLPYHELMPLRRELLKGAEHAQGEIEYGWAITEPLNPWQTTPRPTTSTTSGPNLLGGVTDASEAGTGGGMSAPPSQESRIPSLPPLGPLGLPTPPPSWRLPNYQRGPSRIPVPCDRGTYHGHLSPQRRFDPPPVRPSPPTRLPTPPKSAPRLPSPPITPYLVSSPIIPRPHQAPASKDLPSQVQAEGSPLGGMPFSAELHELGIEAGLSKSRSLPLFNCPRKFRKRLTEESLRVWILRQCYLTKLDAAYEEAMREGRDDRDNSLDLEILAKGGRSFI